VLVEQPAGDDHLSVGTEGERCARVVRRPARRASLDVPQPDRPFVVRGRQRLPSARAREVAAGALPVQLPWNAWLWALTSPERVMRSAQEEYCARIRHVGRFATVILAARLQRDPAKWGAGGLRRRLVAGRVAGATSALHRSRRWERRAAAHAGRRRGRARRTPLVARQHSGCVRAFYRLSEARRGDSAFLLRDLDGQCRRQLAASRARPSLKFDYHAPTWSPTASSLPTFGWTWIPKIGTSG
jgi:hypothetical protein